MSKNSGNTISLANQNEAYAVQNTYQSNSKIGIKHKSYLFVKRTLDVILSFTALLVLLPLILVLILIKWLEDFHNPIYVSQRVGKDGKLFTIYKIRSMCPGADKLKQEMIDRGLNEADGPAFKVKDDPRITRFGRFLRRSSLDEILQLINILKGDMSIVGPRPPLPIEVDTYTDYQLHRLEARGGLLCLWQIQPNRHDISFDDWVMYDVQYIKNQSLWLDIKIIFKGAFMIISGKSGD